MTISPKRAWVLAVAPLLLIGLAGCSSGERGEASGGKTTAAATAQDWELAHAKCMRDAGLDVPDPDADGGGQGITLDDDESLSEFVAGSETCTKTVTAKLGARPVSDERKRAIAEDSKVDDCLRKEGIEVIEGQARNLNEIPSNVQEKCGIETIGGNGR